MRLLNTEGRLTPKDTHSHIHIPINVNSSGSRLVIRYKYYPKQLMDREYALKLVKEGLIKYKVDEKNIERFLPLVNFITISIKSPYKLIGTAHRHDNEQEIVISEMDSTYGFYKTPIIQGQWNIVLHVYSVLSDYVDFFIEADLID